MVDQIDKVKVTAGKLIQVWNTKRRSLSNSKLKYFCVWIEDSDGSNERCLMLTNVDLSVARNRAKHNPEDSLFLDESNSALVLSNSDVKLGRVFIVWNKLRKHWKSSPYYYCVIVRPANSDETQCLLFTEQEFQRCDRRGKQNREDWTEKGFWTDLFD